MCEIDSRIAGFAIAGLKDHCIRALFIHPDHERKEIDKQLHYIMLDWYFKKQKQPFGWGLRRVQEPGSFIIVPVEGSWKTWPGRNEIRNEL